METPNTIHRMYRLRIIVFSIFCVVALSVGAFYYWYTYIFLRPDNVLLRSLLHIQTIQSFSYRGNLHLLYEMPENQQTIVKEPLSFSSGFIGSYKKEKNEESPRISFSGNVNASDIIVSEFESKMINKNVYLFIKSMADIGFVDSTKILNQWIFVDPTQLPTPLANIFIVPFWQFDQQKILSSLATQPPLTVSEVLDPEIMDGMSMYHYRYHIDSQSLASFSSSSQFDVSQIEFEDGEVWIDPKHEEIRGITFSLKRKELDENIPHVSIAGTLNFEDINTIITIDPPQSYIPFADLLQTSVKK